MTDFRAWCVATCALVLSTAATTERRVAPGVVQTEPLTLRAGQTVVASLDQGEADLTVTVVDPDEHRLTFDQRERGVEPLAIVAETTGTYRIEIRTVGKNGGPYRLQIDPPR